MCGHIGIHPHLRAPADTRHAISASRVPGYYGQVLTCLFCSTSPDDAWVTSEYGIAVPAAQPLTPGHVVVAPRRHVAGFYDLDVEEQHGLWDLVSEVRRHIIAGVHVESVAIGFEDGEEDQGHTQSSCRATSAGRRTTSRD